MDHQYILEIFEEYFESLNQQLRIPQNESEYGDRQKNVDDLIQNWEERKKMIKDIANEFETKFGILPEFVERKKLS